MNNSRRTPVPGLLLITFLAVWIHGYHLGVDDAAIYVPGIKKAADPNLYPFGAEFFQTHARLSLFPNLVGGSARLVHLPVDAAIFAWYVAGIFLLLLASWQLLGACFENRSARWSGVLLLAASLSVPVAGTALVIADPYVTARTLSTPVSMFALACFCLGKRKQAVFWLAVTALLHFQMCVYAAAFLLIVVAIRRAATLRKTVPALGLTCFSALPFLFGLEPARGPAREALLSRTYFFLSNWAWYEWMGVFAPLSLLWWFNRRRFRGTKPAFSELSRGLVVFGLLATFVAALPSATPRLENYARLQPMRSFHLLYIVLFLLLGGLIGEYALRAKTWRWFGLFVPLAAGMACMPSLSYPASPRVEWPGAYSQNPWARAFLWVRQNTPRDAVFALDPRYLLIHGEDTHGFRALAERSVLADADKDSGAVSLFPQLADRWKSEVDAGRDWAKFQLADFNNLARRYPITWIVQRRPATAGLACPYQNEALEVCQIPGAPGIRP